MARRSTQRPGGAPATTRRAADARRPGGGSGTRPRPAARRVGDTRAPARPTLPLLGARRSTRRLAVLGGIFVLLGIMLVPTVRAWLSQRDDYAALQSQVAEQERTVQGLRAELEAWKDPAYVEAQARERLTFVYPGETAYQLIDLDRVTPATRRGTAGQPRPGTELTPYYTMLLDSLRTIDQGAAAGAGAPDQSTVPLSPALTPKPSASGSAASPSTGPTTGATGGTTGGTSPTTGAAGGTASTAP